MNGRWCSSSFRTWWWLSSSPSSKTAHPCTNESVKKPSILLSTSSHARAGSSSTPASMLSVLPTRSFPPLPSSSPSRVGRNTSHTDLARFSLELSSARGSPRPGGLVGPLPSPPMSGSSPWHSPVESSRGESGRSSQRRRLSGRQDEQDTAGTAAETEAELSSALRAPQLAAPWPVTTRPAGTTFGVGEGQSTPFFPLSHGEIRPPPEPYGPATSPRTRRMASRSAPSSRPHRPPQRRSHVVSACQPCRLKHLACDGESCTILRSPTVQALFPNCSNPESLFLFTRPHCWAIPSDSVFRSLFPWCKSVFKNYTLLSLLVIASKQQTFRLRDHCENLSLIAVTGHFDSLLPFPLASRPAPVWSSKCYLRAAVSY